LPPFLSVPMSQSVNQRWRERPRCPAPRVTPGRRDGGVHVIVGRVARRRVRAVNVQDERAARVHVFGATFAGRIRLANRTESSLGMANVFPAEASRLQTQIQASQHRVLDAGAVLGVVNALVPFSRSKRECVVGAVGKRVLCACPRTLWTRSVRPQVRQLPHAGARFMVYRDHRARPRRRERLQCSARAVPSGDLRPVDAVRGAHPVGSRAESASTRAMPRHGRSGPEGATHR
jgi:hypothetical protein